MERPTVFQSDRIKVTQKIIEEEILGQRVLEIGAGDYSFNYITGSKLWVKVDLSGPCNVIYDLNNSRSNI